MKELDAIPAAGDRQIEFDALVEIVAAQAQALNDVINSANNLQARVAALNLQARVAALEGQLNAPVTNGKKDNKIIRLN